MPTTNIGGMSLFSCISFVSSGSYIELLQVIFNWALINPITISIGTIRSSAILWLTLNVVIDIIDCYFFTSFRKYIYVDYYVRYI